MAKGITALTDSSGHQLNTFPIKLPVKAGTANSITPGMLVIKDGSNPGYWKAAATGATISLAVQSGVAISTSTDTAAADGTVTIITAPVIYAKMYALTPANLTTAMFGVKYCLSVSSGAYTVDQGTPTNGFINIVNFDNTTSGLCDVMIPTVW